MKIRYADVEKFVGRERARTLLEKVNRGQTVHLKDVIYPNEYTRGVYGKILPERGRRRIHE